MPKRVSPLKSLQLDAIAPREKPFKLHDGDGLYVLVVPSGRKLWRFDYRYDGLRKTLALGAYPAVTIDEARTMRSDARQLLIDGFDPAVVRKELCDDEKEKLLVSLNQASVRVDMDGNIEIWKGHRSIRLSTDEASFIKNQLCKLTD